MLRLRELRCWKETTMSKIVRCYWKVVTLGAMGGLLLSVGGSCVPDNLWADIWGYSLIQGVTEAVRNTVLVGAGLQTP